MVAMRSSPTLARRCPLGTSCSPGRHHARRKGARRSLLALSALDPSRRACASASHTTSQMAPQMPQARQAPARGLRLPGKRWLLLPGRLGRKPHGLSRDIQPSPRLGVLLIENSKLLQKPPPRLLLIRRDIPGQQQALTHHVSTITCCHAQIFLSVSRSRSHLSLQPLKGAAPQSTRV